MSLITDAMTRLRRPKDPPIQQRKFVPGPAVVQQSDAYWGADASRFSPEFYGNYLATSNSVYSVNHRLAEALAGLPIKLYRFDKSTRQRSNSRQLKLLRYRTLSKLSATYHRPIAFQRAVKQEKLDEVEDGLLLDLLAKVNPFWTTQRLIKMSVLSLGSWGRTFWFAERGPSGKGTPKELWWAKSPWVRVVPHATDYVSGYILEPGTGNPPIPFMPSETIWLNYPNPLDEFAPLSPMAASRIYADHENASMQANVNLHRQGLMGGGIVSPKSPMTWDEGQAEEVDEDLNRRFSGVSRAHRWGTFRHEVDMKEFGMTPDDAQFLEGMNWDLEAVARARSWPLDLLGGRRTYENVDAAMVAAYVFSVLPEAAFIASELTEQLLPMFPGESDLIWFDASEIQVLQEAENQKWVRESGQIERGAITVNEWRISRGMEPVPWGDTWHAPGNLVPVEGLGQGRPESEPVRDMSARDYSTIIGQVLADLYPGHEGPVVRPPVRVNGYHEPRTS